MNSEARDLLDTMPVNALEYILYENMTDEERVQYPEAKVTGGYLKEANRKEVAAKWWLGLSSDRKSIIMSIPNFDKEIFKEITGIDVDMR